MVEDAALKLRIPGQYAVNKRWMDGGTCVEFERYTYQVLAGCWGDVCKLGPKEACWGDVVDAIEWGTWKISGGVVELLPRGGGVGRERIPTIDDLFPKDDPKEDEFRDFRRLRAFVTAWGGLIDYVVLVPESALHSRKTSNLPAFIRPADFAE